MKAATVLNQRYGINGYLEVAKTTKFGEQHTAACPANSEKYLACKKIKPKRAILTNRKALYPLLQLLWPASLLASAAVHGWSCSLVNSCNQPQL